MSFSLISVRLFKSFCISKTESIFVIPVKCFSVAENENYGILLLFSSNYSSRFESYFGYCFWEVKFAQTEEARYY